MAHQTLIARVFLLMLVVVLLPLVPSLATQYSLPKDPNRPFQAIYQIESQAAQSGWTSEMALTLGDIWDGLGDLVRAVSYWELANTISPLEAMPMRRLAQSYLDLGRWSQAVIALSKWVDQSDDNWAHFQLAILQVVYDAPSAESHFRLSARDPQYQGVATAILPKLDESSDLVRAMQVGTILAARSYWPAAEYVFNYAASLVPTTPEALASLAIARDQQGKIGSGYITRAVDLAPDNAQVRYLQGIHLQLVGDAAGSLNALKLAAALDPLNPAFAAELGATYDRLGDSINAEYWYKASVTLSNNDPRFQALLTAFYEQPSLNLITATPVPQIVPTLSASLPDYGP